LTDTPQHGKAVKHLGLAETPDLAQQLAALVAEARKPAAAYSKHKARPSMLRSLQKLAELAPCPFKEDLQATISSIHKQLDRTAGQDGTIKAASQVHSSLSSQQDFKLPLSCILQEAQRQLQASQELIAAEQHQLEELKKELAEERRSHALTAEREQQVTAALLAVQQQLSSAMSSARSDQQALSCAQLELAFVLAQLHAADQAAAKHKTCQSLPMHGASAAAAGQRSSAAAAAVPSNDSSTSSFSRQTFACARLSAQANNQRAELQECQQHHQPGGSHSSSQKGGHRAHLSTAAAAGCQCQAPRSTSGAAGRTGAGSRAATGTGQLQEAVERLQAHNS
jgi:hypothetical protein